MVLLLILFHVNVVCFTDPCLLSLIVFETYFALFRMGRYVAASAL